MTSHETHHPFLACISLHPCSARSLNPAIIGKVVQWSKIPPPQIIALRFKPVAAILPRNLRCSRVSTPLSSRSLSSCNIKDLKLYQQRRNDTKGRKYIPTKTSAIPIALIHQRTIRLNLFHNKVVVGAEPVVGDNVSDFQVLVFGVYDPARVSALRQELLEPGWCVPCSNRKHQHAAFRNLRDPFGGIWRDSHPPLPFPTCKTQGQTASGGAWISSVWS